jgi:hypothetical protein
VEPPILSKLILYEYSFSNVPRLPLDPLLRRNVDRLEEGTKLLFYLPSLKLGWLEVEP